MHDLPIFLCGVLTGLVVAWIAIKLIQAPITPKEVAHLRWMRRNAR